MLAGRLIVGFNRQIPNLSGRGRRIALKRGIVGSLSSMLYRRPLRWRRRRGRP